MPEFASDPPDDPYPGYARLRATDPVHCDDRGVWTLTRYDDVLLCLRDSRFGRRGLTDLLRGGATGSSVPPTPMRFLDPPEYTRLRSMVSRAFSGCSRAELQNAVERAAGRLIDRVVESGSMDLIAGFAFPLPVYVMAEILGAPAEDWQTLCRWSLEASGVSGPELAARSSPAYDALVRYFEQIIAERRKKPQRDFLSRLMQIEDGRGKLTDWELFDLCTLLFFAAHQNTVNLIGNGMLALLRHPAELRRLQEQSELYPSAVEELLRYDSPVQRIGRIAATEATLRGKKIPKGAIILAALGAANRDPAQFREPDRLDLGRRDNPHLAFGAGPRFCLGAALARLEGIVGLSVLVQRLPSMKAEGRLVWRKSPEIRGLEAFPVSFDRQVRGGRK